MVVVLPTPFTPTNSHTFGLPRSKCSVAVEPDEPLLHLGLQGVEQLLAVGDALVLDPAREGVEQLGGRPDADVGADQRLLELVPGLVVDLRSRPTSEPT